MYHCSVVEIGKISGEMVYVGYINKLRRLMRRCAFTFLACCFQYQAVSPLCKSGIYHEGVREAILIKYRNVEDMLISKVFYVTVKSVFLYDNI